MITLRCAEMNAHLGSVFKNACLQVPVNPKSKMPIAEYERKSYRKDRTKKRLSVDSNSTECCMSKYDCETSHIREFYESIPDYNDINHLSTQDFYSTLKSLREKKRMLGGCAIENIDANDVENINSDEYISKELLIPAEDDKGSLDNTHDESGYRKPNMNRALCEKYNANLEHKELKVYDKNEPLYSLRNATPDKKIESAVYSENVLRNQSIKTSNIPDINIETASNCASDNKEIIKNSKPADRAKRINSACSISWDDKVVVNSVDDEIDYKFTDYFKARSPAILNKHKSHSVPTSPTRVRRTLSPEPKITIPKPFKMTLRDEDERYYNHLKCLTKSISEEMLDRKMERQMFRANPVPIESRIPLYDKILEDQAMRRAVTKINSIADLQAQMKPFSFTKREENVEPFCDRTLVKSAPSQTVKKKKKFRAKPIPKNLFSNYIYDKMREDDFYRALNRRIRAEELLRSSALPPSMAARDKSGQRSHVSTPGCHISDIPTDTTSEVSSNQTNKTRKLKKSDKADGDLANDGKSDFITTSAEPFHFDTERRALRKASTKKIYQTRIDTPSVASTRPFSALDLCSINRSNLAAVLRIETTKKKIEDDIKRQLAEGRFQEEMRWRDHVLRRKPAWQTVKNTHKEDLAIRLQTRRDEERLRREEYLHQMELMHGRVQQQPLLFERYYPVKYSAEVFSQLADDIPVSPRKSSRRKSSSRSKRRVQSVPRCSPSASRKVSINETAETINGDLMDYFGQYDEEDNKLFSSSFTDSGAGIARR